MGFPLRGRGRAFAFAKVPAGTPPCGSAGRIATGNPPPEQPAVVVASNPATLMHNKKPHTLAGTGLICCSRVLQGGRTHRDSAIIFGGIKNRNIDISMFCFTKTAKNAIFGSLPLRSGDNSDKWHF